MHSIEALTLDLCLTCHFSRVRDAVLSKVFEELVGLLNGEYSLSPVLLVREDLRIRSSVLTGILRHISVLIFK